MDQTGTGDAVRVYVSVPLARSVCTCQTPHLVASYDKKTGKLIQNRSLFGLGVPVCVCGGMIDSNNDLRQRPAPSDGAAGQ